jgi:acetyltransferase-like isoleucine patch superfamily enzyme
MLRTLWGGIAKFRRKTAHLLARNCVFSGLRLVLYRWSGVTIGRNVFIGMSCYLDDYVPGRIVIEEGAGVSFCITIITHGPLPEGATNVRRTVTIGRYANVGANAVILPGVTIGEGAAVGPGSVVTRDVPDYTKVMGNPIRVIGRVDHPGGIFRKERGPDAGS